MTAARSLPPVSPQVSSPRYCFLDTKIRRTTRLTLFAAGVEHCNPDYRIRRDSFPCHGIEFVASGRGGLVLDGHSYPLQAGTLFFYGPGVSHEITTDPGQPMHKYFANFFGTEAAAIIKTGSFAPGKALQTSDIDTFQVLFAQLVEQGAGGGPNTDEICSAYLRIILLKASSGFKTNAANLSGAEESFYRWRDFIDENFTQLRDLNDIAARLHVRPAHLCRVFKQFGQPGPYRYLTRKKLNLAAELLVANRLSVKAAAAQAGYSDPYHFSRLFKAHFSHSPQAFARLAARE